MRLKTIIFAAIAAAVGSHAAFADDCGCHERYVAQMNSCHVGSAPYGRGIRDDACNDIQAAAINEQYRCQAACLANSRPNPSNRAVR
jgi:hypothetical protein